MIIQLDSSFENLPSWEPYEIPLNNLIEAHRKQHHLIFASRSILKSISAYPGISSLHRRVVEQILSKYIDYSALASKVTAKILICTSTGSKLSETPKGLTCLDIEYVKSEDTLDRFSIVVENKRHDGTVAALMLPVFAQKVEIPELYLRYNLEHGGGSTISTPIEALTLNSRMFHVIVDSDRSYPSDALGPTAKTASLAVAAAKSTGLPVAEIFVLPSKDIENLIPIEIMEVVLISIEQKAALSQIRKIVPHWPDCTPEEKCFLAYLDLKEKTTINPQSSNHIVANIQKKLFSILETDHCPKISDNLCKALFLFGRGEIEMRRLKDLFHDHLPKSPFFQELAAPFGQIAASSISNPYIIS